MRIFPVLASVNKLSTLRYYCSVMAESLTSGLAVIDVATEEMSRSDPDERKRSLDADEADNSSEISTKRKKHWKNRDKSGQGEGDNESIERRRGQKLERTGPVEDKPGYYFENGLRKVRPYWLQFVTSAKGRWVGRPLGEVFAQELYTKDPSFFEEQAKLGRVTVNSKPTALDYFVKDNDVIKNLVHRHEMPVLDRPIEIVLNDDDVVVVNKPCSIPSHPCGRYYFNSLLYLLKHEFGLDGLKITHRLDRATSGLILFAKTLSKAQQMFENLSKRNVKKEYLARVEGIFPDEETVCDQPVGSLSSKMGIHCVRPDGKTARTRFQKLFTDGNESVVRCMMETGRTHQIRIHLQYLGYPIVNDIIYNNTLFGPQKGKNGEFGKSLDQLAKEADIVFGGAQWVDDYDNALSAYLEKRPESSSDAPTAKPDPSSPYYDAHCPDCHMQSRDPRLGDLEMYLHCFKYEGPNWSYSTPLPKWATLAEDK